MPELTTSEETSEETKEETNEETNEVKPFFGEYQTEDDLKYAMDNMMYQNKTLQQELNQVKQSQQELIDKISKAGTEENGFDEAEFYKDPQKFIKSEAKRQITPVIDKMEQDKIRERAQSEIDQLGLDTKNNRDHKMIWDKMVQIDNETNLSRNPGGVLRAHVLAVQELSQSNKAFADRIDSLRRKRAISSISPSGSGDKTTDEITLTPKMTLIAEKFNMSADEYKKGLLKDIERKAK